jgi:hypothetical protein
MHMAAFRAIRDQRGNSREDKQIPGETKRLRNLVWLKEAPGGEWAR